jgi:hypothetical protein
MISLGMSEGDGKVIFLKRYERNGLIYQLCCGTVEICILDIPYITRVE